MSEKHNLLKSQNETTQQWAARVYKATKAMSDIEKCSIPAPVWGAIRPHVYNPADAPNTID